jgi:hypothetical protein
MVSASFSPPLLSCLMSVLYTFAVVCYNSTGCASAFAEKWEGGVGVFVFLLAMAVVCYDSTGCASAIAGGGDSGGVPLL